MPLHFKAYAADFFLPTKRIIKEKCDLVKPPQSFIYRDLFAPIKYFREAWPPSAAKNNLRSGGRETFRSKAGPPAARRLIHRARNSGK
ncbi:MAG: hypothetical protein CW346_09220 [Bacillaceae bacterium]|nr:hypothetical protein [Bacillaceae bacterium]